jgi:hypothetical protein
MPNAWTDFVKDFAKRNNTTYGCALSMPKCKEEYRKKHPKPLTKKEKKETDLMGKEDAISMKIQEKPKRGRPRANTLPSEETLGRERMGMIGEDKKGKIDPNVEKLIKRLNADYDKLKKGKGVKMTGGATAFEKGISAEMRTYLKDIKKKLPAGPEKDFLTDLTDELNQIVHSNDIDQNDSVNDFYDETNTTDKKVRDIIEDALDELKKNRVLRPDADITTTDPRKYRKPKKVPATAPATALSTARPAPKKGTGLIVKPQEGKIYALSHQQVLNMISQ